MRLRQGEACPASNLTTVEFRNTGKCVSLQFFLSGFEVDCIILPVAFALTNLSLCPWLPAVFRILVSQILDRTEPVLYSSMSSETITVFQYYNYFASHSVNDLGSYLLQLAKEGRVYRFCWLVREYIPVLLSSTQSNSVLRLVLEKEERKETKKCPGN